MGFILSDMLITLERVADHFSNVAVCIIEMSHNQMDMHGYIKNLRKQDSSFELLYSGYSQKYHL